MAALEAPQWQTASTILPEEAIAKLDLSFYLVAKSWGEGGAAPDIPIGYKVFVGQAKSYLVKATPAFGSADVALLEWLPGPQRIGANGSIGLQPCLGFTMRDRGRFAAMTAQNVGKQLLLCAGDRPLTAPEIRSRIPGCGIIELDSVRESCPFLLAYLQGMPCSEGLALGGPPEPVAGTGRLKIMAHWADGTQADGRLGFAPAAAPNSEPAYPVLAPTVVEGAGQWTVYNITPGIWRCELDGEFVPAGSDVQVKAGEDLSIAFVVNRGGTLSGRVIRAEDGGPVVGATVSGRHEVAARTDADGRYELTPIASGAQVLVTAEGFVPVVARAGAVPEGQRVTAPDIRLERGGWICGRVDAGGTLPQDLQWSGYVEPKRPDTDDTLLVETIEADLSFRLGPLAAGTYALTALVGGSDERGDAATAPLGRYWKGQREGVVVKVGEETTGVTIPVGEVKQP